MRGEWCARGVAVGSVSILGRSLKVAVSLWFGAIMEIEVVWEVVSKPHLKTAKEGVADGGTVVRGGICMFWGDGN